jgi:hypothetical protein
MGSPVGSSGPRTLLSQVRIMRHTRLRELNTSCIAAGLAHSSTTLYVYVMAIDNLCAILLQHFAAGDNAVMMDR